MSDEFEIPAAPAPEPTQPPAVPVDETAPDALADALPPPPVIPDDVPPVTDEQAFAAAQDPSIGIPATAAPGSELPQGRKAKFPFYRDLASGEVYTALRTPAGYEDDHPDLYEGLSELPKDE